MNNAIHDNGTDRMDVQLVWYSSVKEGLAHRNGSLTGHLSEPVNISPSIVVFAVEFGEDAGNTGGTFREF